jgi:upstream activation factor subunit UAF30
MNSTSEISDKTKHFDSSKQDEVHQDALLTEIMDVYNELSEQRRNITRIMANVKKCYTKVEKRLQAHALSQKSKESRQSGLTKPFPVSTSLCTFMSVPEGTQLARAEVTKYLHRYIKDKDLYDASNKQFIKPDLSLKELLNIDDKDEPLHIFSMQKKMNTHFNYNCDSS